MKTHDSMIDNKGAFKKSLKFTCPECGHHELAECYAGYVMRSFIDSFVCRPRNAEDETGEGDRSMPCEIRYGSRADGSEDFDFVEDNYGVYGSHWFACVGCDSVLEFEDGWLVKDKKDLAEWLIEHNPEENSPEPQDNSTEE